MKKYISNIGIIVLLFTLTGCGVSQNNHGSTIASSDIQVQTSENESSEKSLYAIDDIAGIASSTTSVSENSNSSQIWTSAGENDYYDKAIGRTFTSDDGAGNMFGYKINRYADKNHLYIQQTSYISCSQNKTSVSSNGDSKEFTTHDFKITYVRPIDMLSTMSSGIIQYASEDGQRQNNIIFNTSPISSNAVTGIKSNNTVVSSLKEIIPFITDDSTVVTGASDKWNTYTIVGIPITNEDAFKYGLISDEPTSDTAKQIRVIASTKIFVQDDGTWTAAVSYSNANSYDKVMDSFFLGNIHFEMKENGKYADTIKTFMKSSGDIKIKSEDDSNTASSAISK